MQVNGTFTLQNFVQYLALGLGISLQFSKSFKSLTNISLVPHEILPVRKHVFSDCNVVCWERMQ